MSEPLQYNYWQRTPEQNAHIEAMASLIARQDREIAALREVLDAAREVLKYAGEPFVDYTAEDETLAEAIRKYDALKGEQ